MTISDRLLAERVMPVVRGLTAATAQPLAGALALGGLTTIEVTIESPDAPSACTPSLLPESDPPQPATARVPSSSVSRLKAFSRSYRRY